MAEVRLRKAPKMTSINKAHNLIIHIMLVIYLIFKINTITLIYSLG